MLVMADFSFDNFFFSSRRRHTRCELVNGVQTCALPISARLGPATPGLVAAGWWLLAQRKAASPPQTPPLKRRGLQCPLPVETCRGDGSRPPIAQKEDAPAVGAGASNQRSEESREGKEGCGTGRTRGSAYTKKKQYTR